MPAYLAPGVYLRPKRTETADVRLVRTDVAGFLGFTERGPLSLPDVRADGSRIKPDERAVRLTSWEEYRATFGGLIPHGHLPFAVRGFFENGGTTCYVMRVAVADPHAGPERARVARWVFLGDQPARASSRLLRAARKDDTILTSDLALRVAQGTVTSRTSMAVEIVAPDGSAPELHVLVGAEGPAGLSIGGRLRRGYPDGTTVRLHEAALEIEALSAGNWGNRIRLQLTPLQPGGRTTTDFALRVTLDPGPDTSHPHEEEFYRLLSIEPRDDSRRPPPTSYDREKRRNPTFIADLINGRSRVIRVVYPLGEPEDETGTRPSPTPLLVDRSRLTGRAVHLEGGQDGLRGLAVAIGAVPPDWLRALEVLDAIDEIAILSAPDVVFEPSAPLPQPTPRRPAPCAPPPRDEPPRDVIAEDVTASAPSLDPGAMLGIYAALLEQCDRRRDRVAILDPPARAQTVRDLLAFRNQAASLPLSARRFAATYGPWLLAPDPTQSRGGKRAVPPSGHLAGVYAQVDNAFGVHRPPANVAVAGALDVVEAFSTPDQEALNPRGINALRTFPGRGIRVWGARSLSDEPDWRFIHARRLMSMIEESVDHSMQWAVFEPNDDSLRRTIVHALSVFLRDIWQKGGLKGNVPTEAFYVKCDETNNPPAVVDAGQIVCQVGVAVAAPMEFIVFEIRQTPEGAEIVEL
jgi:uncharacterized protein